jgi:hypothetical protein
MSLLGIIRPLATKRNSTVDRDRFGRPCAINVKVTWRSETQLGPDRRQYPTRQMLAGPASAEPTALERGRDRHREFRDRRDGLRREAEKLWTHEGRNVRRNVNAMGKSLSEGVARYDPSHFDQCCLGACPCSASMPKRICRRAMP